MCQMPDGCSRDLYYYLTSAAVIRSRLREALRMEPDRPVRTLRLDAFMSLGMGRHIGLSCETTAERPPAAGLRDTPFFGGHRLHAHRSRSFSARAAGGRCRIGRYGCSTDGQGAVGDAPPHAILAHDTPGAVDGKWPGADVDARHPHDLARRPARASEPDRDQERL
ncbi:hypothetical protein SPHINGOAX6_50040 [Sphingomonas sp. AX6]|nr:hypothetical protein SPHINGOAX6_50040 [Sphingomonas sp. AX6]